MKRPYCTIKNKLEYDIKIGHPTYCCQDWIGGWVNEDAVPVSYNPYARFYYIICQSRTWVQTISRCIVCNHEFPKELGEEWIATLEKECGLEEVTV